jgi:hypothetical protein
VDAFGQNAIRLHPFGPIDQIGEELRRNVGQITRDNETLLARAGRQRTDNAAERAETGPFILDDRKLQGSKTLGRTDESDRPGGFPHNVRNVFHESPLTEWEERLVASHPPALSAAEHKTGSARHERILASRLDPARLWGGRSRDVPPINRMVYICFLIAWGIVTSFIAMAAPAPASNPHQVKTVVRADSRTGRLVRSVIVPKAEVPKPAPAKDPGVASDDGINDIVEKTARAYEVDPALVHSVIKVESNYNPYAVSPKGARGLMQLIPSTARRFGVYNTFDARQNVEAGVRYLRYLQDLFGNDKLAVAAYNAGEGAVLKHGDVPPYRETQNYVAEVGRRLGQPLAARPRRASGTPMQLLEPPDFKPLEVYTDEQGRVYLLTR